MTPRVGRRSPQGWLWSLAAVLALACGNLTMKPKRTPHAGDGGETNAEGPTAGKESGGPTSSAGGASGGVTLLTGGTSPDETDPVTGGWGAGGFSDYPDEVQLCIYADDIPAGWAAAGVVEVNGRDCAVGVLGRFVFMNCLYELLDVTPGDVDAFTPGHSHCCYKSRLLVCK